VGTVGGVTSTPTDPARDPGAATPAGLLAAALRDDPASPLLTQYDDATGERVELSAATLDNWVAKTANLLVHGAGTGPGARAAVLLPPHWQTAAVLLGCWSAGLAVAHGVRGGAPERADVAFAGLDRVAEALGTGAEEVYALSLAPLAAPVAELPPGTTDYATEVRAYGDSFSPATPPDPGADALVGALGPDGAAGALWASALVQAAADRAAELGLVPGDRLLVLDAPGAPPRPLDWLLVPLAARASLVLCRNPDPGLLPRRAADERVTVALGIELPGVRTAGAPAGGRVGR